MEPWIDQSHAQKTFFPAYAPKTAFRDLVVSTFPPCPEDNGGLRFFRRGEAPGPIDRLKKRSAAGP